MKPNFILRSRDIMTLNLIKLNASLPGLSAFVSGVMVVPGESACFMPGRVI
jgi:hypothetical protein